MSLFEQADRFQWRDTWFVWLKSANRPTAEAVKQALDSGDDRHSFENMNADENGLFDSVTVIASHDGAAMDISFVDGSDVAEAAVNFATENSPDDEEEQEQLKVLVSCDARFEVYHFEEINENDSDSIDPGALLIVLDTLAELCDGVTTDPQSDSLF